MKAITFQANFDQGSFKSMKDGGFRFTLEIPDYSLSQFTQLLELKERVINVAIVPEEDGK